MSIDIQILEKLSIRTIEYIKNDLSMNEISDEFTIEEVDNLVLMDISALIALSGEEKGTIGLSVSDALAKEMVKNFIYGEIAEDKLSELASENVAETLNIVLGNILNQLDSVKNGAQMDISTPYIMHNSVTISKKTDGKMYSCRLKYQDEYIILSYFL